ncbi:hypothetical protein KIW84_043405 [Lathyrus oleraceus]|uniref:Uncharacterized protein n=1 Tax=Pisum sativum TaxID=3888 RepID=A0A9D4XDR8_PEA|nr:hypothetical protein KIW84_043405 [Pisum sativum]
MDNKKWGELDLRASSIIHMSLAKNTLANILGTFLDKVILEKLEGLYRGKGISNQLLLKDHFHSLPHHSEEAVACNTHVGSCDDDSEDDVDMRSNGGVVCGGDVGVGRDDGWMLFEF